MFNLLLYGRAFSNVFDGVKELGGGADAMVLRGAPHQGHYGLLTLIEHYDQLHVGAHLKQPRYPVWVVHSEGHFSVLFVPSGAHPDDGRPFDLTYYDQLGGYDEPFRLTIGTLGGGCTRADAHCVCSCACACACARADVCAQTRARACMWTRRR